MGREPTVDTGGEFSVSGSLARPCPRRAAYGLRLPGRHPGLGPSHWEFATSVTVGVRAQTDLVHPAVFKDRQRLGAPDRPRPGESRHPLCATHQGSVDLWTDQEPMRRPVAPGSNQAGEHRPPLGIEVDDALEMVEQTEV